MSSDPLSRFRVIDLTRARAGPTCVRQFADFGADVIKVEPPAYASADGHVNVGTFGNSMWVRLCEALGQPQLARRPEYLTATARLANRALLDGELSAIFATRRTADWVEAINRVGVPCGPIYKVDELFADQDIHLPLHASVQHRRLGSVKLVSQMVELSRTPAQLRSAIPELGEHIDAILAGLGYDAGVIAGLRARRVV